MSRALVDDAVVEGRSREKLLDFSPLLTTESMRARLAQKIPFFMYHLSYCESIDPVMKESYKF